jgi:predicted ATPase
MMARVQVRCPVVTGRAAELDRLNTLTAAVARGTGSAGFLGSEARIGKTRLVRSLVSGPSFSSPNTAS